MAEKSSKFSELLLFTKQSTPKNFIRKTQFAGFVAMHSRNATCFMFSVELKKLTVAKIHASKIPNVREIELLRVIPTC